MSQIFLAFVYAIQYLTGGKDIDMDIDIDIDID